MFDFLVWATQHRKASIKRQIQSEGKDDGPEKTKEGRGREMSTLNLVSIKTDPLLSFYRCTIHSSKRENKHSGHGGGERERECGRAFTGLSVYSLATITSDLVTIQQVDSFFFLVNMYEQ